MNNIVYQISVVMPVHNTGIYLEEALDSLFNQNFINFELICIDDASDDKLTIEILKNYQFIYKQMRVIWIEESIGAAKARNIGLEQALGEYIIFLDSDDVFHENILEHMYKKIKQTNSEVCFCGFRKFSVIKEEKFYSNKKLPREYDCILQNRPENWLLYTSKAPWNKLIKRSFLKENHISFQNLSSANDVYFSILLEIKAKKICYCKEILVEYRTNNKKQISSNRDPMNLYFSVENLLKSLLIEEQDKLYSQILIFMLNGIIYEILFSQNEKRNKETYFMVQNFLKNQKSYNFIKNIFYKKIYKNFVNKPYEDQWYKSIYLLEVQYKIYEKEIKKDIAGYSKIVLWGMGFRGNAFQKFCKTENIMLFGCTDIKNKRIGLYTKYGIPILNTEEVPNKADMIIACNNDIYNYILKTIVGVPIINLQKYEI